MRSVKGVDGLSHCLASDESLHMRNATSKVPQARKAKPVT
jgi:hypothetical protein